MTVLDTIKELSERRGKTLRQVTDDLNFSENYLYSLKTKTPNGANLEKLADYFNVSVDYLLGRAEAKPVNEPIDLAEVANSDDDAVWSRLLSSGGRPLTEKDKMAIKLLFSDKWDEITQKAKDLDNKD
ncbi:helix-turn-helix domain-containing protein [Lactococcus lactis]|uniref:helix-turn-helix domain-containing protein n=1 Tax=Lactococcus lactis TaxID=1358 RepID=UPI00071D35BD|nr:helix-turn-helix transcriptional regulator [Lactococcus lactis]ARE12095.2 helix-turn-helix transcriptional regulator [Lactococcus lactis subsp. lactis]MCH5430112.1 helix-turn-helix domain-containing protein [Lactococcus lactis]UPG97792.1 helix-turn-helix domain-containing protein [Lactococcus lactis]URL08793.1 helix-turn-helix domain-containing protein [Lactococcus lactis subsp. lactis]GEB09672.1 transcriptional regulator [Lactococcus lactis subsp. lactis]